MTAEDIKKLIEAGIPGAKASVTGEGGKYEATVVSDTFVGLSMVKAHQMVYGTVNQYIASGELHALSIKTLTTEG